MAKQKETQVPATQKPMQKAVLALSKLKPTELANDERVHKKFVTQYNNIHGSDRGELFYQSAKYHFTKAIQDRPELQRCTIVSLYGVFVDIAVQAYDPDPAKKEVYIVPYGTTATLQISGPGELKLRVAYGQIKHAEKPTVVYDCDTYEVYSDESTGKKKIKYRKTTPRPAGAKVIASFISITRNDGSVELIDFDRSDFDRWRSASKQPNSLAWEKHYPAMISTKTIKHAFGAGTYPKINLKGNFTKLESEVGETEDVDYGLVDEETGEVVEVKAEATPEKETVEVYGDKPQEEKHGVTAPQDEDGDDVPDNDSY